MPAVGFAVNVNAIAAANLRSNKSAKEKRCSIEDFNKFVKDAISPYVESMNEKDKKEWETNI